MSKFHWLLLMLYLAAAGGYGGWRGQDFWSSWGIWCFLIPPVAWVALVAVSEWGRNPMGWTSVKIALVMGGFGVVGLFGSALGIAWLVGQATGEWSARPLPRAIVGAAIGAVGGGIAMLADKRRKTAAPQVTIDSEHLAGDGDQIEERQG